MTIMSNTFDGRTTREWALVAASSRSQSGVGAQSSSRGASSSEDSG